MGKFSRNKGNRGEREFWRLLADFLPDEQSRMGRNLDQWVYGGADSRPDMYPFSVEIKRRRGPRVKDGRLTNDLTDSDIDKFYDQAFESASNDMIPVVAYRADRQRWKVIIPEYAYDRDLPRAFNDPVIVTVDTFARLADEAWHQKECKREAKS